MTDRILIVTRNFPPLVGGMERLVFHAFKELQSLARTKVLGPHGCEDYLEEGSSAGSFTIKPAWRFLIESQYKCYAAVRRERPHLILAGSGAVAPAAWLAARRFGAKVAVMLHGFDISNQHLVYRGLFVPAIRNCDRIIANSAFTAQLAAERGVPKDRLVTLHPGVARARPVSDAARNELLDRIGQADGPILLSVGRLTERKGLIPFIKNSFVPIQRAIPNVRLVIIGDDAKNALANLKGTATHLRKLVADLGLSRNVALLGQIPMDSPLLGAAYEASALHVFPIRHIPEDIEGFGMVAVEAAAHGLPTVAFRVGGVVDAVSDGESGYLVDSGDYAAMAEKVIALLCGGNPVSATDCLSFASQFEWSKYGERLRSIAQDLLLPRTVG